MRGHIIRVARARRLILFTLAPNRRSTTTNRNFGIFSRRLIRTSVNASRSLSTIRRLRMFNTKLNPHRRRSNAPQGDLRRHLTLQVFNAFRTTRGARQGITLNTNIIRRLFIVALKGRRHISLFDLRPAHRRDPKGRHAEAQRATVRPQMGTRMLALKRMILVDIVLRGGRPKSALRSARLERRTFSPKRGRRPIGNLMVSQYRGQPRIRLLLFTRTVSSTLITILLRRFVRTVRGSTLLIRRRRRCFRGSIAAKRGLEGVELGANQCRLSNSPRGGAHSCAM